MLKDGSCESCKTYTMVSQDGKTCEKSNGCKSGEKMLLNGVCEQCSPYTKVSRDGASCIADDCDFREIV